MRYLSRIVFINSAKTSYAEIYLDGNVHFIGTQGVGKSTLLRAILFFYNADKTKLGIDLGREPFDRYYFPNDNSYIVYEVARETGPFCIIALRSQGRCVFRFINGAYEREHFISPAGMALTWEAIKKGLDQGGMINRKVDKYEEYRDILYGNNQGLPAEFRKYSVLESKQYQNIPRTIQNVFLNSKLDAEFIKQTIIKSLNEEDVKLDLNKYALHLRRFDTELADILSWSHTRNDKEVTVRKFAEKIIDTAGQIHYTQGQKLETLHQIIAAWSYILKEQPKIEKVIGSYKATLDAANEKLHNDNSKFNARKEKLQADIAVLESDLAKAKQKSKEYASANIEVVLARAEQKDDLIRARQKLTEERALLLNTFNDVVAKYEAQISQAEGQLQAFLLQKEAERHEREKDYLLEKESIATEYRRLIVQAEQNYSAQLSDTQSAIDEANGRLFEQRLRKKEAQLKQLFEEDVTYLKGQIATLQMEKHSLTTSATSQKNSLETLSERWQLASKDLSESFSRSRQHLKKEIQEIEIAIRSIETTLEEPESSLYSWLCSNMPGWEHNIGKVIDEKSVLFRSDLSPTLSPNGNNDFLGIAIDFTVISKTVKTIADYQAEVDEYRQKKVKGESALSELDAQEVTELEALRKRFSSQIAALKEKLKIAEYEFQQIERKLQKANVDLDALTRTAIEEKTRLVAEAEKGVALANTNLQEVQQSLATLKHAMAQDRALKEKESDKKIKEARDRSDILIIKIKEAVSGQRRLTEAKVLEIKKYQLSALHEAGADAERIKAVELASAEIEKTLNKIDSEASLVSDYRKDKRELIDRIPSFAAEKKMNEQKLQADTERVLAQQTAQKEVIHQLNIDIEAQRGKAKEFDDDIEEAEKFKLAEPDFEDAVQQGGSPLYAGRRLKVLCEEAFALRYTLKDLITALHAASSSFAGHFSEENIFGFPTSFANDDAYFTFAGNLKEFLEEDKIRVFEKQVNTRYADIIKLIGKETTDLVSKEGEIQKVITKINSDFEERAFAGVIKSIRLRLSSSQNKLVTLLQQIRLFNDENNLSLGAANLFSTGNQESQNKKAIGLLQAFRSEIAAHKAAEITLSDSFELQFRIVENDNDSEWVESLSKVGSEGTDVLVKAMINIMLLNVFKEGASRRFSNFKLHCMMDEIGKLHPTNVKGILKFANDRNILLINSSPTSYNATDYKYTYLLSKDKRHVTTVKQLVKKAAVI